MDEDKSILELPDIPEKRRKQLVKRVEELAEEGILKPIDWWKIYEIMIDACERASAEVYEDYLVESLKEGEGDA